MLFSAHKRQCSTLQRVPRWLFHSAAPFSYPPHSPFPQFPLLSWSYLSYSGTSPSSWVAVGKKTQSKNRWKHYDFFLLASSLSDIISRYLWVSRSSLTNPPFSVPNFATGSPPWQHLQLKGNAVFLPDDFVTLWFSFWCFWWGLVYTIQLICERPLI